ncbi:glutathione S-transferase N-terminal domain-containing protein [Mitsuaria sp. WAJ17]|nr:glutathione S-transferase N-terminal domain-containing protein [Mitsuaria sp. WAJ17]
MQMLGLPFEERLLPFASAVDGPAYAGQTPNGRVPCLEDGELIVWDSLAIVEYIAELAPQAWPAERAARAWARSACAEMHAGFGHIRGVCTMNCGLRVKVRDWTPALLAEWARMDALWCEGLRRFGGPFLAGSAFTAVDAFFAPVALRVQSYTPALSPAAQAYAQHLLALPPLQAWYQAALLEPWRDPPHEAEAQAGGEWLQDLRVPSTPSRLQP